MTTERNMLDLKQFDFLYIFATGKSSKNSVTDLKSQQTETET